MLGTGNATVTNCFNTCFVLSSENASLLVDAGGGNGILKQLKSAKIAIGDMDAMYLTHSHTDHLLGAVWVVRMIATDFNNGNRSKEFHIYGHEKVIKALETICSLTLPAKVVAQIGKGVRLHIGNEGDGFEVGDMRFVMFDIRSTKEKQFGFRAVLPNGKSVVCLGDEPFNEDCRRYAENADWLLCEAFCLYEDRDIFHPYEKHHSTALEAGKLAQTLGVKNLLLYHTEDKTLATRRVKYTAEAARDFTGRIIVPDDLDIVSL